MAPEEFRALGHALVDRVAGLLGSMNARPVTTGLGVSDVKSAIHASASLPLDGDDAATILSSASDVLIEHSLYNGHPKFLGYITSSPAPIGMLADFLASAVNANVGAWTLSPVATEIESQTVRWIAQMLRYPATASGVLVSGGNQANFVGIYTALRKKFPHASPETPARLARATIYASSETHTWIEKACAMFGLPSSARRYIRVDSERRMVMADLEAHLARDIAEGFIPLAIVGSAGTVSTGAVDPMRAIADLCAKHDVWMHVDGAYGGFAAMLDDATDDLRAIARADSLAIDPHKWLYAPIEAGCTLIRDSDAHRAAYSYHPPYYHFGEEATNFVDYGPQNTRGFRALKVWMAIRQVGLRGYQAMIGDDIALSHSLHDRLAADARFAVYTQSLSITTFRYVPDALRDGVGTVEGELAINALNKALQARLERSGELFVSNAVIGDTYLLRACIVNFRTSARDIAEIPDIVARHGDIVARESLSLSH